MTDKQLEDQLNDYWDDLVRGVASPSTELRSDLAATVQLANNLDRTSTPTSAFTEALGQKLAAQAATRRRPLPRRFGLPGRLLAPAGLVGLALLGLAAFALYLWAAPAETVTAAQIVEKARAVAANPSIADITSFEMTQITRGTPTPGVETGSQTHIWYEAPNKWRFETTTGEGLQTSVGDGQTIWAYDSASNSVKISSGQLGGPGAVQLALNTLGTNGACERTIAGEEQVAGRAAYVVNQGPASCKPMTIWVDKETYFILKVALRSPEDGRVLQVIEETEIRYNLQLDDSLFTFTPPPGATIHDERSETP